jgi:hypothetical protein
MMKEKELIFAVISDEIFTDREELLAYLKKIALGAKMQRYISHVLIGHRRVGKTEVLKRLYNQLFWEQDEVTPIYITYEELSKESKAFAGKYLFNFLSQYIGFKEKDPKIVVNPTRAYIMERAMEFAQRNDNQGIKRILEIYQHVLKSEETWPWLDCAVRTPRLVADWNKEPIFVMLDEFQHVIEIKDENGVDPNVLGRYQQAVESRRCPHLVTGSAVTLLTKDIIGRGSLFGRFRAVYIRGLEGYHVFELCQKLGKYYGVEVNPEMSAELARRTGGNPFYLDCIFDSAGRIGKNLSNIDSVNEVISYELTQGAIWSELYRQLNYYFMSINEKGITKNIFYFATRYKDEKIDPKRIAENMKHWKVTEVQVRDVLLALSRADLIEEKVAGTEFYNIKDPIIREFVDAWARVDVENATWEEAEAELLTKYRAMVGKYADFKGYTAELVIKFLMTKFDERKVEGTGYFNRSGEILLPRLIWVDSRRVKLETTPEYQIDIVGKKPPYLWIVEVKHTDKAVGISQVKKFEKACAVAEKVLNGEEVTRWYISVSGFSHQAASYLRKKGFFYSDREQVNQLLGLFGLRILPV